MAIPSDDPPAAFSSKAMGMDSFRCGTRGRWAVALVSMLALPALALAQNTAKQTPPIKLGTSGGSVADLTKRFCCAGTLGSLVASGGTQYILSNNHVLARSGSAA